MFPYYIIKISTKVDLPAFAKMSSVIKTGFLDLLTKPYVKAYSNVNNSYFMLLLNRK